GREDPIEAGVLGLSGDRLDVLGAPAHSGNDAESEPFSHRGLLLIDPAVCGDCRRTPECCPGRLLELSVPARLVSAHCSTIWLAGDESGRRHDIVERSNWPLHVRDCPATSPSTPVHLRRTRGGYVHGCSRLRTRLRDHPALYERRFPADSGDTHWRTQSES